MRENWTQSKLSLLGSYPFYYIHTFPASYTLVAKLYRPVCLPLPLTPCAIPATGRYLYIYIYIYYLPITHYLVTRFIFLQLLGMVKTSTYFLGGWGGTLLICMYLLGSPNKLHTSYSANQV
jgi:hypothetical protein